MSYSTFSGNVATTGGGAIANASTSALNTLKGDTFSGNNAGAGAGIANQSGAVLAVSQSTFSSNTATGNGGGIDNAGTLTVANSTLASNAAASGGAVSEELGTALTLINDTIAFNSAASGAGIATAGALTLINVTDADNVLNAGGGGGGLAVLAGGKVALYNTIIAQNSFGTGAGASANDIAVSGGGSVLPGSFNNLIGSGGSGGLVNGGNNNLVGLASAGLAAALASNGGPTQTLALVAASPAIDAGIASITTVAIPNTDERGALRGPRGLNAGNTVDIGAFEASSSYLVTTTSLAPDVGTITTAAGWANISTNANARNLPASASNPQGNPQPNTIVFDVLGVFSTPQTITLSSPINFTNTTTPEAISGPGPGSLTLSGGGTTGVLSVAKDVTATFSGLTISGGSASSGGALTNFGNTTVTNDELTGNTAASGAAIANQSGAILTLLDSTLAGNTATQSGGGLDNAGTASITNSTFTGNTASLGAAIFNTGTLQVVNATIAYNNATTAHGGGGLLASSGTASVYNTIIAQNTSGTPSAPDDVHGTISAGIGNLIDDAGSAGGLSDGVSGNFVGHAAGLAAGLGNNGGSTQTIALQAGSLAINTAQALIAGVAVPTTDQRGALRNQPGSVTLLIDTGAYQVSSTYAVTTTTDSNSNGTLRSAIAWANTNPESAASGPNTILFEFSPGDPGFNASTSSWTIKLSPNLGTLDLTNTAAPELIGGPGENLLSISGGGAVGVFNIAPGVTATLENLTVTGGTAASGAGILNQGNLTVTDTNFTANGSVYYGGAIFNDGGTLTVNSSTFSGNLAQYGLGAAIDNDKSGTVDVSLSTFTGGNAFEGGAIDNRSGSLFVSDSTFANNHGIQGGAIYNNASAAINGSTFSGNQAFQGGAIANDLGGTMTLANSTLAGNHADQNGGGVNQVGVLLAVSSTFAYNTVASGAGAGIDASAGTTTIYDTIVVSNTVGTGTTVTASDIAGSVDPASSNNMVGSGNGGLLTSNANLIGVTAPDLGPLASNGGPTETVAVLAGSPAIAAGAASFATTGGVLDVPTTDQRGITRLVGSIDIGAYQSGLTPSKTQTFINPTPVATSPATTTSVAAAGSSATTQVVTSAPGLQGKATKKVISKRKVHPSAGAAAKLHKANQAAAHHLQTAAHHSRAAAKHPAKPGHKKK